MGTKNWDLAVGAAVAIALALPAGALADPAPETSIGSGVVLTTSFDVDVTGGPFGQDPTGSLSLSGVYNFTATATCMNIADNQGVVGFRINDGPQQGEGFLAASETETGSRTVQYSAVLTTPPTVCPPDDAPAPPNAYENAGGGPVNGEITDGGGPASPLPLFEQQFSTAASPGSIAQSTNGTLWFTEPSTNELVSISDDAAGRMHDYAVPTADAGIDSITPDATGGGMWFTESKAEQIGHVTRTGTIVEYPVSGARPSAIAGDPSGGAWFTEAAADRVAHISQSGNVTEYQLPTSAADPTAISADASGGGAWFVEKDAEQIGHVDAAGNVVEYPLPDAIAVTAISADGTGGAWFTAPSANVVGYIDSSGDINQYPLPTANAAPEGIASGTGPDGTTDGAWFAETGAGQLAFISPSGQFSEFTLPGSTPGAVAFAPSINLPAIDGYSEYEGTWWTDSANSDVGFAAFPLNVSSGQPLLPPPPAPSKVVVRLARRVTVRRSRISLTLRCEGASGACRGQVSVISAGARAATVTAPFAKASFSIASQRGRALELKLDRVATRMLRAHRRGIPVTVDVTSPGRFTASVRRATLRLG